MRNLPTAEKTVKTNLVLDPLRYSFALVFETILKQLCFHPYVIPHARLVTCKDILEQIRGCYIVLLYRLLYIYICPK